MSHQKGNEKNPPKVTTIKITGASDKIKALSYHHHTNKLTIECPNTAAYNFINRRFEFDARDNVDGRKPTDYGLVREPDNLTFVITKNPTIALDFLCFCKQITKKQQQKMGKQIESHKPSTVFKNDKNTANTPVDENESSNNSCCNQM